MDEYASGADPASDLGAVLNLGGSLSGGSRRADAVRMAWNHDDITSGGAGPSSLVAALPFGSCDGTCDQTDASACGHMLRGRQEDDWC